MWDRCYNFWMVPSVSSSAWRHSKLWMMVGRKGKTARGVGAPDAAQVSPPVESACRVMFLPTPDSGGTAPQAMDHPVEPGRHCQVQLWKGLRINLPYDFLNQIEESELVEARKAAALLRTRKTKCAHQALIWEVATFHRRTPWFKYSG